MSKEDGSNPGFKPNKLNILLQPEERTLTIPRVKTVRQLLAALDLEEETALVVRDGALLTPDRHLEPGETILVRKVGSRG